MKPSWLIGDVLKKCGVPCAEEIAMMLGKKSEPDEPVVPDIPDTPTNYLAFASSEPFTLSIRTPSKHWDGTLYASSDAETWNEWDGTTTLASAEDSGEQRLYMRGVNNTHISVGAYGAWVINGNAVKCSGNIENLLNYETVESGEHPPMQNGQVFGFMFRNNSALITPPELPAIKLTKNCYYCMFENCPNLKKPPILPATELADYCYSSMFAGCLSLEELPELPAATLASNCYNRMFEDCLNIKLSETKNNEYQTGYRIPTNGNGTNANDALYGMFNGTGGTFTGTPEINTTYYTSNEVI